MERGEKLEDLSNKTKEIKVMSVGIKKKSKKLNKSFWDYFKCGPCAGDTDGQSRGISKPGKI